MSHESAIIVADQISTNPKTVLGLATGSTPLGLYNELIKLHNSEGLDFSNVISFNHKECDKYESLIKIYGGIDLQILGIGSTGHIAFNEPSSSLGSRTRLKTLTQKTVTDNAKFFDNISDVPKYAVTMGVGTIMEAKKILLLASGDSKAKPITKAIEGPISSMCSASAIQMHPKTIVIIDEAAAKNLKEKDYYKWVYRNKTNLN